VASAKRRRWLLALAGLAVAWFAVVAFALLSANREIRKGLKVVDSARGRADASAVVEGRLLPELRTARSHFASAHSRVDGPLLAPVRIMPVVGRQLRSVSALSGAATSVADVAISGMTDAQPVLDEPGGSNALRAASARRLGELAARAEARLGHMDLGPRVGLVSTLARARNRLGAQVAELRGALSKGAQGGTAVADLLTGPRRYLVLAANNAEMRAGSGMFLSAGELETGPEGLRLGPMRSVGEISVPVGAVPLTGDLADRWGWLGPNVEWRNLMTSPRFDTAAPVAAEMWAAAGNRPVDGVMALDPVALRGLLRATGPVEVDGLRFDHNNVVDELLHRQYLRFPDREEKAERQEGLGRIARSAFEALDSRQWSITALLDGLSTAARGRHLMMWSASPPDQAGWEALDVAGALQPDSLLVSLLNRCGIKIDPFIAVSAEIGFEPSDSDTEVQVRIDIENTVPVGKPPYVSGPNPESGVGEGAYLGIVTLTVPAAATNARFDGVDDLGVAGADGPTRVVGFQLQLERGERRTVVGRFRLPGRQGDVQVEPSARVPATRWSTGDRAWSDSSTKTLHWTS
jgi:hypothetical protein